MAAWHNEIGAVRSWYQTEHDNWTVVAGHRSRWWVWDATVDIAKKSVVQIQTYLQRISEGDLQYYIRWDLFVPVGELRCHGCLPCSLPVPWRSCPSAYQL